jgi:hypothetical protein
VAAGIAATSRQVGAALGIAVTGAVIAAGARPAAWWIIAGCGLAILALGILTTGPWAARTAAGDDPSERVRVPRHLLDAR